MEQRTENNINYETSQESSSSQDIDQKQKQEQNMKVSVEIVKENIQNSPIKSDMQSNKSKKQIEYENHEHDHDHDHENEHENENMRWVILLLATISQIGGYICINFPAYLQLKLKNLFEINDAQYNLLFSSISIPNIFLPFIIGYLCSKVIGPRVCFFSCILIIFIGQFLSFIAVKTQIYYIMIIGRFFVGIGFTNANAPRQQIITKWFQDKELGFALGSFLLLGKLSVVFSAYMFGKYQDLQAEYIYIPIFFTCIVCIICVLASILMVYFDKQYTTQYQIRQVQRRKSSLSQEQNIVSKIKRALQTFNPLYWVLVAVLFISCILFFQTQDNFQEILLQRNGIQGQQTVYIFLIPSFMQSALSPLTGIVMDKYGNRTKLLLFSSFVCILTFIVFITNPFSQYINNPEIEAIIPFILLGLFQGLNAGVKWPALSLLIENKNNIAFGVGTALSVMNLGQCIAPVLAGMIIQEKNGYVFFCQCQLILTSILLFCCYILHTYDDQIAGGRLNEIKKKKQHIKKNRQSHIQQNIQEKNIQKLEIKENNQEINSNIQQQSTEIKDK